MPVAAIAVLLVGMLANLALNAASAQAHWPGWLDRIRVYAWIALVIFALVLAALTWLGTPQRKDAEHDLHKIADRLAQAVKAQWDYETERRRIFNPYALPVRWVAADAGLFTPWPVIVKQAAGSPGGSVDMASAWAAGPNGLAGGGTDLVDVFCQVPTRRLVVLGEPGAGKTILLVRLLLELLTPGRRQDGGPVPILLPVASWNPVAEDLHGWIVRWLATDPAGLARLTPDALATARELLNAGLILPILDGFDEIPDRIRRLTIVRINEAIKPCPGLILSARTEAYRDAVQDEDGSRTMLAGATGIELRPLAYHVVAEYLKDAADNKEVARRWRAVIKTFTADDPSPVARALTTPLMVTLARAIYNPRDNESAEAVQHHPAELLNHESFSTREEVERYLLDKFIWAAYRPHHDPSHQSRRYLWDYEQAKRWLVFLARNQEAREGGSPDIAWWRLHRAAPRYLVATAVAVTLGFIGAVGYPFVGFGAGVTAGLITGFVVRRLRSSPDGRVTRGMAGGLVGGLAAGLIALSVIPLVPRSYGIGSYLSAGLGMGIAVAVLGDLIAGLAAGFTGGIVVTFYEHAAIFDPVRTWVGAGSHVMNGTGIAIAVILAVELSDRREVPAYGLRLSFPWMAAGLGVGLVIGLITALQIGWTAGFPIALLAPVAGCLTGAVASTVESKPTGGTPPIVILRRDRGAFLGSWLVLGIALALITGVASALSPGPTGHPNGVGYGVTVALSNLIIPGLGLAFIQARWGTFSITRCWLALKGELPWRLMTFLDDAHVNRGVFRQVGAVYQFRHIDLQRRISTWSAESGQSASIARSGAAIDCSA